MKRVLLMSIAALLLSIRCEASELPLPSDRVIQFLTNVHTNQKMNPDAWLSRKAKNGERFKAFGGLDAVVIQSSKLAHEYRGLRSIEIKHVSAENPGFVITAEVKFFDEDRRRASPAMAEREDMVWTFRVEKENRTWKLAF